MTEENNKKPLFSEVKSPINNIAKLGGFTGITASNALNLYGLSHRGFSFNTAKNTDVQGFTFFTRPDLRLTYDNLIADRQFALMLTDEKESIWRWVRATLDPRGQRYYDCPFVDSDNPFIPVLSNNLKSMSGWSELTVEPYTSDAGVFNEQTSQADGFDKDYSVRQITCTFKNQIKDPINALFNIWTRYSMLVRSGEMDPYLHNLVGNIIDYNTRAYRLVTDASKQYVQSIAATGVMFPLNSQLAAKYDFDEDKPYSDANDEITIQFQTIGFQYEDPILIKEFNELVHAFCPGIKNGTYAMIENHHLLMMNGIGIPLINEDTGRIEWWARKSEYHQIVKELENFKIDI